jgi:hypothetical protein
MGWLFGARKSPEIGFMNGFRGASNELRWSQNATFGWFRLKRTLRVALLLSFICAAIFVSLAHAQQIDVAGGLDTIFAASGGQATGNHQSQSLDGGTYPVVSADVIFYKHVGVQGEFAWRVDQGTYAPGELNIPYRPLFWDINAIWAPKVSKRVSVELMGGVGEQSTRFYSGSKFAASNHLMGDVGGGIKFYAWRHFFLRPEARFYLVNNNLEFSSAHALRYGVSIGYTFKPRD